MILARPWLPNAARLPIMQFLATINPVEASYLENPSLTIYLMRRIRVQCLTINHRTELVQIQQNLKAMGVPGHDGR